MRNVMTLGGLCRLNAEARPGAQTCWGGTGRRLRHSVLKQDYGVEPNMMLLVDQESDVQDLGLGLGGSTADDASETTQNDTEI